jgi:hypothetical protein
MRSRSGSGSDGSTGCLIATFNPFSKVSQDWLIRFVEHRMRERRIIRLIAKWLTAGVLEDGRVIEMEEGTPQGAVMAPRTQKISDTAAGYAPPGTGKAARGASWRRIAGLGATPAALHSALRCTGASATIYLHRPPAAQGRR